MPFAIDDPTKVPSKGCDLSDVIVELHNGGKYGLVPSTQNRFLLLLPITAFAKKIGKSGSSVSRQIIMFYAGSRLEFVSFRFLSQQ